MGTVRYTTVGGEVIAEKRGGVRRQYVPDPLGSTVALLDNSQAKTDTFAYWPYGEEAARTGTTDTPLRYVGTKGYYRGSATRSYVRARHLDTRSTRWMTQDPIGFTGGDANLYTYVNGNPASSTDRTGLQPDWLTRLCCCLNIPSCCKPLPVPTNPPVRPPGYYPPLPPPTDPLKAGCEQMCNTFVCPGKNPGCPLFCRWFCSPATSHRKRAKACSQRYRGERCERCCLAAVGGRPNKPYSDCVAECDQDDTE